MTSDRASQWAGDVRLGVSVWVGEPPPRHGAEPEAPDPGQVPDADPESVARRILLDQLTGQARSRAELAAKLAQRNVPTEIATRLLNRFEEVGLVDDLAFARMWTSGRQASRGLAKRALAQELRRKGVPDDIAGEALDELDPAGEEAAARALVRKRLRSMDGLDEQTKVRRLAGMLARKGYPPGLAFAVVKSEVGASEDLDMPESGA
ncbi:regulatory protein RecX [Nocardioides sp.]|uniref:regulatory protein RecX n=1 Tax=Nocardioides sp. TaxID=35761 RepID=UPI0039E5C82A